jgi:phosphoribosylamine--glycine ligase
MKVLVVGNGGREHALCWKLNQSPSVEKVYCAPGNAGTAGCAENADISVTDLEGLATFAENNSIDLTVAGPEVPLCAGIVNVFKNKGLAVFGPDKDAAALEGSKEFAKNFMKKYGIPTAEAKAFSNRDKAEAYINQKFAGGAKGIVVKADGLAAGKGVIVAMKKEDALEGLNKCFEGEFGKAGGRVLLEECLFGEEASILALCDGNTITPLASSQDHKRLMDNDMGPNTGGMGAYSPAPVVDEKLMKTVNSEILENFLKGVKAEKLYFRGVIYAGIMVTEDGPKVLEFNVRFGDPETQAVLARLESDLAEIMLKTASGKLEETSLEWDKKPAVCVVMASGGYPGSYRKGYEIKGLMKATEPGVVIFHAGTALQNDRIVNSGGRVLGVTAKGDGIEKAVKNAYRAVEKIHWQDAFFRKDIATKAIRRQQGSA